MSYTRSRLPEVGRSWSLFTERSRARGESIKDIHNYSGHWCVVVEIFVSLISIYNSFTCILGEQENVSVILLG